MVNTWKYSRIFGSKNMSEGIKAIIYVEEQPEHIRKQLISFIPCLTTSQTQIRVKKERSAHTHMFTPTTLNQKKKKKKECAEKRHSPFPLPCIKLSQSGNYLFPISSHILLSLTHCFLAKSSFLFLNHIKYTSVSRHSLPVIFLPKILVQLALSQPRRFLWVLSISDQIY